MKMWQVARKSLDVIKVLAYASGIRPTLYAANLEHPQGLNVKPSAFRTKSSPPQQMLKTHIATSDSAAGPSREMDAIRCRVHSRFHIQSL